MIVRTSQQPTHPSTREPGRVWEPKSEGDWWKKLPEWNASRKLNCRERAERRRRQWGSFGVRQSNKRSAEISASPLTRSDRACTGSSHLHGHTGNGPLKKRCFTGPFFSSLLQLPGQWRKEGGMFTFLSPCSAHVPVPLAAGCSRMGGRDCSPNSKHLILISLEPKEKMTNPWIAPSAETEVLAQRLLSNMPWQRQLLGEEFGSGRCTTSFLMGI